MENRILIVDNEEKSSSLIARKLNKEGYSCAAANSGKSALNHLGKEKFSLLISGIKMPEMDGLELLKKAKAMHPGLTAIMMADFQEIDMAAEAMRMGAFDFIKKPVDLDQLVLGVKKALLKNKLKEVIDGYHTHLEKLEEEKRKRLQEALRVLKKANLNTVNVLVKAIEAKDPYTRDHSDRVRKMCMKIGLKLDLNEEMMENLEYGSLLHDIGMIGIADEVLHKQGRLSSEEYRQIKDHPMIGAKILEEIDFFRDKLPMILHHHEHFDGSGYPDGLRGETIPLEARIILIADAFDAMTSMRYHRKSMPVKDALMELERGKGKQFDPYILGIFLNEKIYDSSIGPSS